MSVEAPVTSIALSVIDSRGSALNLHIYKQQMPQAAFYSTFLSSKLHSLYICYSLVTPIFILFQYVKNKTHFLFYTSSSFVKFKPNIMSHQRNSTKEICREAIIEECDTNKILRTAIYEVGEVCWRPQALGFQDCKE